jgi:hypothetical protein
MDLARHYFISSDLDDLESVEEELVTAGVSTPQIHVLSRHNADVHNHPHLNGVSSFMKRDLVHSAVIGSVIGAILAVATLITAFMAGWTHSAAGWLPFLFLAFALFGFFAWLGGLYGLQVPNVHFRRFQSILDEGKHIFFVDIDHAQENTLSQIVNAHPNLQQAGTGESKPSWLMNLERTTSKWWYWRMWRDA